MKKRLGLVVSLPLCTAASADAACTLGSTVLEEVSRFRARSAESVTHAKEGRVVRVERLFREERPRGLPSAWCGQGSGLLGGQDRAGGRSPVGVLRCLELRRSGVERIWRRNVQRGRVRFPGADLQVVRFPPLGTDLVEASSGS